MLTYATLFVVFIIGGTVILSWPLGRYMKWAMDPDASGSGRAGQFTHAFQSFGGAASRASQDWKQYMIAMLVFNLVMFVRDLRYSGVAAVSAAQPGRHGTDRRKPDLQHRGFVHFEHQSPALLGRIHAELPLAARRADVAAVRLGGDRHCRAGGAGPWARRPQGPRQLLRRFAACRVPRVPARGARCRDAHGVRRNADDV